MGCSYSRGLKTPTNAVPSDQFEFALRGLARRSPQDSDSGEDKDDELPYAHLHKDELPGGGFDVEEDNDSVACVLKKRVHDDYKRRQKEYRRAKREREKNQSSSSSGVIDRIAGGHGLSPRDISGTIDDSDDVHMPQEIEDRRLALELVEEFQLDDLQEITDAQRISPDPILDSEKRSTVQQRLFSVFDREESKNRQRQRLNRFKKNEREDMSRANMIGIRVPGLAIANLETTQSPTSSSNGNSPRSKRSSSRSPTNNVVEVNQKALLEITNMGFDESLCRKALARCRNNKALAIEYVMSKLAKGGQLMADSLPPSQHLEEIGSGEGTYTLSPPSHIMGQVSLVRTKSRVNFDDNVTEYS